MLLDEKSNELKITATEGSAEEYIRKPNVGIERSISGRAVKEKKPVAVLDVASEQNYMFHDLAKKVGVVSLLSVPMLLNGKIIGVINVYTGTEHVFSNEETGVFQAIANQAASAIEKTRLNEEVNAAKEALKSRKVMEKAKGLLMKELKISEEEAHKMIHRKSMDLRKSVKDISEAIILSFEMKNAAGR
jgi:signal transduction protein with GAF and PtsI domain